WIERAPPKREAGGSTPPGDAICRCTCGQLDQSAQQSADRRVPFEAISAPRTDHERRESNRRDENFTQQLTSLGRLTLQQKTESGSRSRAWLGCVRLVQ